MRSRYAAKTEVAPERGRAEIEVALKRFGCDSFVYGYEGRHAIMAFRARGRNVRLNLLLPNRQDKRFTTSPTGQRRRSEKARAAKRKVVATKEA